MKNKKNKKKKPNAKPGQEIENLFKTAVKNTPEVASGYCTGLRAMGNYAAKVQVADTKQITGSVDIDGTIKDKYPDGIRWDYVVGYRQYAHFVEVHSAETSEVKAVLAKLEWLKNWLKTQAPELAKIQSPVKSFVWIPSGRMGSLPGSPQAMRLYQRGLKWVSMLWLM